MIAIPRTMLDRAGTFTNSVTILAMPIDSQATPARLTPNKCRPIRKRTDTRPPLTPGWRMIAHLRRDWPRVCSSLRPLPMEATSHARSIARAMPSKYRDAAQASPTSLSLSLGRPPMSTSSRTEPVARRETSTVPTTRMCFPGLVPSRKG